MGPEFVSAYAPLLALSSGDGPPSPGPGISEEIDASTGLPAPFIQSGGVRQYFGTELRGRATPSYTPGPTMDDELRGRTPPAYFTDEGGFPLNYYREEGGEPQFAPSQYPGALGRQPENPPSEADQHRTFGMAPTVGIPPQVEEVPPNRHVPLGPRADDATAPIAPRRLQNGGMGIRIPPQNSERTLDNPSQSDLDFGSSAPQNLLRRTPGMAPRSGTPAGPTAGGSRTPAAPGAGARIWEDDTIEGMLRNFGIEVPDNIRDAGRYRDLSRFSREEGSTGGMRGYVPRRETPDPNRGLLEAYPRLASAEDLSVMNERLRRLAEQQGFEFRPLRPQWRTQQQQDQLVEQGAARSRRTWHLDSLGRGLDLSPDRIGGLRGPENIERVRQYAIALGYPPDVYIRWESGRGRHQGTGAHYHIEPPDRFNYALPQR